MPARKENLLLAVLPRAERERLDPFLEWGEMAFKQIVVPPLTSR